MNKNLYAVILAGGSGTRFWPMSRQACPKQFLNVTGHGTLLQQTVARVASCIPSENILVVAHHKYKNEILRQLKSFAIAPKNILLEPEGRNTAPAIGWAAAKIYSINPDGIMIILPSDHIILNQKAYIAVLDEAVRLAARDYLVTLGIVPTRPDTGYGYIKIKKEKLKIKNENFEKDGGYCVEKFIEKPDLLTAKKFVASQQYFWNSGMFVWKAAVILEEFQLYLPKMYQIFYKNSTYSYIQSKWSLLESVSIDYGILEKSKRVVAVPAKDIGWSDLGSWESLLDVSEKDKNGNVLKGDVVVVDTQRSLIWAQQKCTAVIGLEDMIIVDLPDVLLICHKSQSQKVKDVVAVLKGKRRNNLV